MKIIISFFQAGGNNQGNTHSGGINWVSFDDKIDFKRVRKIAKETVINTIEGGCPCVNEMEFFYSVLFVENDIIFRYKIGDFKSIKALKW